MNKYKWYRRLRGGYWIKFKRIGWRRTTKEAYEAHSWVTNNNKSFTKLESWSRLCITKKKLYVAF